MVTSRRRNLGLDTATTQRALRFVVALGLLIYEAVLRTGDPRWPLLVVYGGMMGLPLAERADDLRRSALDRLAAGPSGEDGG